MSGTDLDRVLRAFAKRHPFRSFLIEFQSGDRILVSHPEAIEGFGELFLYRSPDRSQRIFAAAGVCQLIDPAPTASIA
jgi:hypothetical protein